MVSTIGHITLLDFKRYAQAVPQPTNLLNGFTHSHLAQFAIWMTFVTLVQLSALIKPALYNNTYYGLTDMYLVTVLESDPVVRRLQ